MEENPLLEEVSPDEVSDEEVHAEIAEDIRPVEREEVKALERA